MDNVSNVMKKSILVNITLSIIKIFIGIIGRSGALIADGIHSISDLTTDLFAIFGSYLSKKPEDKEHPYGHGKYEYITSIGISLIILFVGCTVIYNSTKRGEGIPSILVLIVTLFTIITKYILANYIYKKGLEFNNSILIASGNESKSDVISSMVVLISTLFMFLSKYISIFRYADKIAMIIVGLFIVRTGFLILKENINTILGETETDPQILESINKIILKNKNVLGIDKMVLLKYGSYYKLIGEISMNENMSLKDVHDNLDKIEKGLKRKNKRIKYVTIHVNPIGDINDSN